MSKFVAKKHLVRSPTLLIGVGGIGGQIVNAVNCALSDYDRSSIKMVVMDTDTGDLDKFVNSNIPYVQTSENQTVQDYLAANPSYLDWFPTDPLINAKSLIQGAGQIRSVSRLGALASKAEGRFVTIDRAVEDILTNQGDALTRAVRVMIVGSVTGGTGSGLGIQLPFYVRKVLEQAHVPNVLVRGLFLMPSLTAPEQDTHAKQEAVNVNGYAFLKELNAFYRMQKTQASDNLLRIEEYVPGMQNISGGNRSTAMAAMIPYDFLYMVEKLNNQGNLGDLNVYIDRSAQVVINQLFSPISNKGFSVEDNLITSMVPSGGMNRYCGAGIANAIYPKDEVVRYCAVRFAGKLLGDYWLQIDNEFRHKDEQQRRLKKTNPDLASLDRGETYCQIFDDICDPQKHTVVSEVAELNAEMNIDQVNKEGQKTRVRLPQFLMKSIDKHLDDVFTQSQLKSASEACHMTSNSSCNPSDVSGEAYQKLDELRRFRETCNKTVNKLVVATAEEILSSNLETAQGFSANAGYNLYVALQKKHPIAARYILYTLRKLIQEQKAKSDARLSSTHISIFDKDYYETGVEGEQKETPSEALNKINLGFLHKLNIYSAAYKNKVTEIVEDVSAEASYMVERAKHTLKSTVYRIVLERIDTLIKLYEDFFDELGNIMMDKAAEAEVLEAGRGVGPYETFVGDKYICSNRTCKQFLYNEFLQNVTDAETSMSDDVKKDFFDKMFGEYAILLLEQANPTAFVVHLSYRDLFEEGILQPIVAQFSKKGFKHLDMSILDAIYKQFQIEKRNSDVKKDSPEFKEYFRSLCNSLTTLAEPYLTYERQVAGYPAGGLVSYAWGLSHSGVADFQTRDPNADSIDQLKLNDLFSGFGQPQVDDSFSPYKLVCYATIYDMRIENCVTYKIGTPAEQAYHNRLDNLANKEFVISKENDGYLDVIHPHLDRRWHEHAYLPELMGYDEDLMCKEIRLAFLLAMALNRCDYVNDEAEYIRCWCYLESQNNRRISVRFEDKDLVQQSIFALYRAFDRNRLMVADMIKYAEMQLDAAYDNISGVTVDDVMAQPIIRGLLGKNGHPSVLDLLYNLYTDSGNREENIALVSVLADYLKRYCAKMTNNHEKKTDAWTRQIMEAIGDAAQCLKAPGTSTFFKDDVAQFCKAE